MRFPSSSKSRTKKTRCFRWARVLVERILVDGARPPKRDDEAGSQAFWGKCGRLAVPLRNYSYEHGCAPRTLFSPWTGSECATTAGD